MKKHLPKVLGLALLLGASGCMDLDEQIVSGVTAGFYESPDGLESAVNAAYNGLNDLYAQERHMTMLEYGVDIWVGAADGSHKQWNTYDPRLEPATAYAREQWDLTYRAINTANTVITRAAGIPLSGAFTAAVRDRRVAEVRFLRALYYFYLIRHYGDVHLSLEETQGVVTEARRTPVAEIYSQAIIPDLEAAIALLPANAPAGRATRGAAQHLLALVYLTRNDQGDAARAETLAKAVIDSGAYGLLSTYREVFLMENEASREVVFAVQFTSDPLNYGNGNRWHLYWGNVYDQEPGMVRTTEYGRPFRRLRPSAYMLDSMFVRSIDDRFDASFNTVWFANNPTTRPAGMQLGDTAMFFPMVKTKDLDRAKYCGKPYRIYTEPDNFWAPRANPLGSACPNLTTEYNLSLFPVLNKHLDPIRASVNQEQGQRDFIVYRLADTYLLVAEALIRQGKQMEAAQYVNTVRRRAAKPGQQAAMEVTAADMTLDFILAERGRELFGEGHRWFDLARFGKLVEYVSGRNLDAAPNIRAHHVLRPIPQTQIDRTKNADGTPFGQNPGY
jgi:starch-binding outer membrane protein, SusD/RagB family